MLPIRDSYRVADGFLAGEYPGSADPARPRAGCVPSPSTV